MIIMGIDPGIERTGIGIIEKTGLTDLKPLWYGLISTDKSLDQPQRLEILDNDLRSIISKFKPQAVGIEELFFSSNQKSVMRVGEARGIILLACKNLNIPITVLTPNQVKANLTGYGNATKDQIALAVCRLLHLAQAPTPDDITDALGIAICTGFLY